MKFEFTLILEDPRHLDKHKKKEIIEFLALQSFREIVVPVIKQDADDIIVMPTECKLLEY